MSSDPPPERPGHARDPRLPVADERTPVRAADMSELVHRLRAISDHLWERDQRMETLCAEVRSYREHDASTLRELSQNVATGLEGVSDALETIAREGDLRGQVVQEQVRRHNDVMIAKVEGLAAVVSAKQAGGAPWTLVYALVGLLMLLVLFVLSLYARANGDDPSKAMDDALRGVHAVGGVPAGQEDTP